MNLLGLRRMSGSRKYELVIPGTDSFLRLCPALPSRTFSPSSKGQGPRQRRRHHHEQPERDPVGRDAPCELSCAKEAGWVENVTPLLSANLSLCYLPTRNHSLVI